MDTISELAAAGFFFAAGLLVAVTAPDWIIGAAVGVCLLLVGTVLFQKGMKQLIQEMQTRRTEEREQTAKQFEKLQTALDELQASEEKRLGAMCSEVADLHTTAKDASEKAQEAAEDIIRALDNQKDDQRRNIEKLCGKLDNTAKDICAKLNSQQTELQTRHTEEREQTAKQLEKLQTALDELRTLEEKHLEPMYNEIADLNDAAKDVCEKALEALEAVEDTMRVLDDKEEDQCKDIKDVCKKLDDAAKDICEKLSSQQTELQTFLKVENEANHKSMEQIMKNYSDVTEQDVKVLTALGEEVRHG